MVVWWVERLVVKIDGLNSMPRNHRKVKIENVVL